MARRIVFVTCAVVCLLAAQLLASSHRQGELLKIRADDIESADQFDSEGADPCFWQSWWQNNAFYWRAPDSYADDIYAQRFTVSFLHKLERVRFMVYDADDGHFGDDDIYVTIFNDDGSRFPGSQIAQVTVPAGTYLSYPSFTIADFSSFDLIVNGDFHVGFSTDGIHPAHENCVSSNGNDGDNRSTVRKGSTWRTMLADWGLDVNFLFPQGARPNIKLLFTHAHAACSHGSYRPPEEIRTAAVERRFEEVRAGNAQCQTPRLLEGAGTADLDTDKLCRTFPIPRYHLCQFKTDHVQRE